MTELSYPPLDPSLAPRAPEFGQPVPLLTFSYTPAHEQVFDDRALRFLAPSPPRGADLKHGYVRWVRKPDTKGRLDGLLRALSRRHAEAKRAGEEIKVGVCTWRGVMTKILTAPYEDRDTITLNAQLLAGTLYLEEQHTPAQLRAKNDMPPRQREQTYFGYAFEAWSTAPAPAPADAGRPVWGGDVDTNEQWCVVVKTRLGPERLVLGGEVDCVQGSYDGTTANLVELKTNMVLRPGNAGDAARFDKKTLRIWTQSFLLGVPRVCVGFRTHQGVVRDVQAFDTAALPRRVRGRPGAWDPAVVLGWGARALAGMRAAVEGAPEGEVWRVELAPGRGMRVWRLEGGEREEVGRDEEGREEDRVGFLPRWYWEEFKGPSVSAQPAEGTSDEVENHAADRPDGEHDRAADPPPDEQDEALPLPDDTPTMADGVSASASAKTIPAGWSL